VNKGTEVIGKCPSLLGHRDIGLHERGGGEKGRDDLNGERQHAEWPGISGDQKNGIG